MERMKKMGELMIPLDEYPHVPYWFTLRQVMAVMEKSELYHDVHGRKSLPRFVLVFDEAYQLLGIVRRRDLLRGLEPPFMSQANRSGRSLFDVKADPNLADISYDKLVRGMREQAERQVSEVMIPIQATVDAEDAVLKAIYEMVENNVSLLPVLRDNKVVGVIRSVELFHEISKLIL